MNMNCPCGGGQNCIIHKRLFNEIIVEDEIFKKNGLQLRENCYTIYTKEQMEAMTKYDTDMQYDILALIV